MFLYNLFQHQTQVHKKEYVHKGKLAELVGVSRQTISSIETNQYCPSAKLAMLLCYLHL
ncbi:helix-turn-helix transcriptional regulator [Inconstantimicrobium porci]|uniref:Helix-turn-helix domain-containing protein n=1 Tax=Inconstantimicrobium porci TaxID=2652291 RepID=A0A7X2N009_9CLOT|nr:helix-turn-helix domain-containing protein [Inconstantimicrobium porci]